MRKYFPHKEFREYQEQTINDIITHIENGEKNIILQADVGFGKSAIAKSIQQYIETELNESTYIVTSSKYLQDQYLRDFDTLLTAKGRQNFNCKLEPEWDCDNSPCKTQNNFSCPLSYAEDCGELILKDLEDNSKYKSNCEYWTQKINAINNYGTILNYPYIMLEKMFVGHFKRRKCLILDEAHNIENQILNMFELTTSARDLKKDLDYVFNKALPTAHITPEWYNELDTISTLYYDKAKQEKNKKRQERLIKKAEKYEHTAKCIHQDPDNWVIENDNDNIVFKPIDVSMYANNSLLDMGEIRIFMSGTILRPQYFAKSLGLDSYVIVRPPNIIPPKQRPIVIDYVGSMSSRNISSNIRKMAEKIKQIAYSDKHKTEKGLIHTYTYNVAKQLQVLLGDDDRFLFHESHNRESVTNNFKMRLDNSILVSPYSYEGVDFKYEQARFQIIAKQPFPFLSKQLIQKDISSQQKGSDPYLFVERCKILSQMYGRICRSPDDYGITYLLDLDIRNLLGDGSLASTYFWEGISGHTFNDIITVSDESKASQPDELEIINDIKSGLNTITKLRDAYIWNVDGPSYKMISPLVQKMIKNNILEVSK